MRLDSARRNERKHGLELLQRARVRAVPGNRIDKDSP
jgi:hypothetical protein